MFVDEPTFMPYAPGAKVVEVIKRIHEGLVPQKLTETALVSLGAAEGNADRVHKALRFLGLVSPESDLTDEATRLRRAKSDEYEPVLGEIVKGAYEPVFQLYDPATASGIDLNNAFKPYDPAGQRPQMISLFMALSREAGLAPTNGVRKRGRPPGSSSKPRIQSPRENRVVERPLIPAGLAHKPSAFTKAVKLHSGSVSISVSVDLMELEGADRNFVFSLIDALKSYEKQNPAVEPPGEAGAAES